MKEKKGTSRETYTIINKETHTTTDGYEYYNFKVKVSGSGQPRDGRYHNYYCSQKIDPNIRWQYETRGVYEHVKGEYSDVKTENETLLTLLDANISISNPTEENATLHG